MKKTYTIRLLALTFAFFLLALSATAQAAAKGVNLSWTDGVNPAGTKYSVYRAAGTCTGTPAFTQVVTGLSVTTYRDLPGVGQFCYKVTATSAGIESNGSNTVAPTVPPVDVTLAAVVQ